MKVNKTVTRFLKTAIAFNITMAFSSSLVIASDFGDWDAPEIVPDPVSTSGAEGCQFVTPDGLTMYFATSRTVPGITPAGGNDLYVVTRASTDDSFGNIEHLSGLASPSNDICPVVTPDGKNFYFVSNRSGDDQCGGNDIFMASSTDDGPADWGNPVRLGCDINSLADDEGPQFFVNPEDNDDVTLYFSSNRSSTTFGGYNILMLDRFNTKKGRSQSTVELMPGVNTNSNDRRGSIRADGLEIIIESNRSGSIFSGSNLWRLTRVSLTDDFSNPLPEEALNSHSDEFRPTLVGDGSEIYFMSNIPLAEGGAGGNDIWHATRPGGSGHDENQQ